MSGDAQLAAQGDSSNGSARIEDCRCFMMLLWFSSARPRLHAMYATPSTAKDAHMVLKSAAKDVSAYAHSQATTASKGSEEATPASEPPQTRGTIVTFCAIPFNPPSSSTETIIPFGTRLHVALCTDNRSSRRTHKSLCL